VSLLGGFAGLGGASIGRASVDLVLNTLGYQEQLAATEAETTAATGRAGKGFAGLQSSIRSSLSGAQVAMVGFGAVAAVAIGKGISATQEWAASVRSLQRVTGLSAESASALAAAGETLGLDTAKLNTGFGLLAKNIVNASANLTKYGTQTKDATGNVLPFEAVLGNVIDKLGTLQPGAEQTAFAMNVFGRSGKDLIPILQKGRDGLAELEQKARDAGLVMSQDDLNASKDLTIAQRELGEAFKGASISLGKTFVPILTTLVHGLTAAVELIQKIPTPVLAISAAFVVAAGSITLARKAAEAFGSSLSRVVQYVPLIASLYAAWTVLSGVISDARRNFDELSQSVHVNADLLRFLQARMDLSGSAFEKSNEPIHAFVASLDGASDNLDELTGKLGPSIEAMQKMGLGQDAVSASIASANNYLADQGYYLDGSSEAIDRLVAQQQQQVTGLQEATKEYENHDITLQQLESQYESYGLTAHDALTAVNADLDQHGKTVTDTGRTITHFAAMSSKEFKDWSSGLTDSITSTFLTLGTKTKDIFNVTQKQLDRSFRQMLANALRFKNDVTQLMALKAGTFGLNKTDMDRFKVFMQDQGPGYVDAFVNASKQRQERYIREWERTNNVVAASIRTSIPKLVDTQVRVHLTGDLGAQINGLIARQLAQQSRT